MTQLAIGCWESRAEERSVRQDGTRCRYTRAWSHLVACIIVAGALGGILAAGTPALAASRFIHGLVPVPGGKIEANLKVVDGYAVFDGDIIVAPVDQVELPGGGRPGVEGVRGASISPGSGSRWPENTIPYEIASDLPYPERVTAAIRQWEVSTPIRFVPRTSEADFVRFQRGSDCSSSVGRQDRWQQPQRINLTDYCDTAATAHEIGHAVGLWHEQSRKDRDDWIIVDWDNIRDEFEYNFQTYIETFEDGVDVGPFDFKSIMLYPSFLTIETVLDPRKPAMKRRDGTTWRSSTRLSEGDIATVVFLYTQDASFAGGHVTTAIGPAKDMASSIALDSEGRAVVVGHAQNGTSTDIALVRYNRDGTLDDTFGNRGKVTTAVGPSNDVGLAVAIDSAGRIVVAGYAHDGGDYNATALRYDSSGNLDPSFGYGTGKVVSDISTRDDFATSVAIDHAGRIVVAGYGNTGTDDDVLVWRYKADGTIDRNFGFFGWTYLDLGGDEYAAAVAIDSDDSIVVAGEAWSGGATNTLLARFAPDGLPDESFGSGGSVVTSFSSGYGYERANHVLLDRGRIYVAATFDNGTDYDVAILRYDSRGMPDRSFGYPDLSHLGSAGRLGFTFADFGRDEYFPSLAVDSAGRVLVACTAWGGSDNDFALVRFTPDGLLDESFGGFQVTTPVGPGDDLARAIAIDANDKIFIAGSAWNGANYDFAVVRSALGSSSQASTPVPGSVCGNGILEPLEECDDRNQDVGDGCTPLCAFEPDLDVDGLPDPIDHCVNQGGTQSLLPRPAPRLTLGRIDNLTNPPRYGALSFSGELQMPAGWSFSEFDPNKPDLPGARGAVEFFLMSPLPSHRLRAGLLDDGPSRRWTRRGRTWTYVDETPEAEWPEWSPGITKMTITDRRSGRVKVVVKGRNGALLAPIKPSGLPLQAIVVLGRTGGASERGECGESDFSPSQCKLNARGDRLSCKG